VGKRLAGVTSSNTRLIEEGLLPMMTAVDSQSGEIVAQVNQFHEYFPNKQAITQESKQIIGLMKCRCREGAADEGTDRCCGGQGIREQEGRG
jgi:hypothetical protein